MPTSDAARREARDMLLAMGATEVRSLDGMTFVFYGSPSVSSEPIAALLDERDRLKAEITALRIIPSDRAALVAQRDAATARVEGLESLVDDILGCTMAEQPAEETVADIGRRIVAYLKVVARAALAPTAPPREEGKQNG